MSFAIASVALFRLAVGQRRLELIGDVGERVAAQLEGQLEVVLRFGQLARGVQVLDPVEQVLGGAAVGGDLRLEAELCQVLAAGSLSRVKNSFESCWDWATIPSRSRA